MMRTIVIVVFDGVTMLDVAGPAEAFAQANREARHYRVVLVSPRGGDVSTSSGMALSGTITAEELIEGEKGPIDTVLVAGGDRLPTERIESELLDAVVLLPESARRVASVRTGAFVLARLGMLDGRRATTHWRHADRLTQLYPLVRVDADRIHVTDGHVTTSAGISAGTDLALTFVEDDLGPEVARMAARELVVYLQRPGGQNQYGSAPENAVGGTVLQPLLEAVRADPTDDHSLASMARSAAMSTRQLSRLFRTEVGTSPVRWAERARLSRAQELLVSGHSIASTPVRAGFGSDETLRRTFLRHHGITPTDYRERFTTTR